MKLADQSRQSAITLAIVSAVTSIVTAMFIFAYVLPVYYGVDPIGWGGKFGIASTRTQGTVAETHKSQQPSQTAAQTINESNASALAAVPQPDDPLAVRRDAVELVIPPKQSLDYRLAMERDYDLDYTWTANGKSVYAELRGEPGDGKAPSKTFAKLTSATGKGFFIIPFNGQFGWHWQNKSDQPVTIRLHTKGTYQVVGQIGVTAPG